MKRETRIAIGIVTTVVIIVATWFGYASRKDQTAVPAVTDTSPVPAHPERQHAENDDTDIDDQAEDVTRIIIKQPASADDVRIDEVLAGKVIVDDKVVQEKTGDN